MAPRPTLAGLVPLSEHDALLETPPLPITPASNSLHIHNVHDILKRAPTSTRTTAPTAKVTHAVNTAPVNPNFDGGAGSRPASDFNNQAFLALFAALGAVFVIVAIWFFFWAKNGGFHFQEGDWDDYKSTVLRRKGPDGRTLTNATKSTKLGGSTIAGTQHYKWAKQQAKSVVSYDHKGRKGILGRRGWGKTHSVYYSDDFTDWGDGKTTYTDMKEARNLSAPDSPPQRPAGYRDRDVQEYKREKPARVGGLNRVPDGSHISSGISHTEGSDLYSDSDSRPIMSKKERTEAEKDRAERRARAEAAKVERRWKKEAEEAAAAIARERARSSVREPAKSTPPPPKHRQRSESRSASPRKRDTRDFSYQTGPESELLSTSATSPSKRTSSSYYDAYRPRATENARYPSAGQQQQRQGSPGKKPTAARHSGYRRGADSDLD